MGWPHPAYRIETPRLTLRCYEPRDVDALHELVLTHADALRAWMPWLDDEPIDRAARSDVVRRFRGRFDLGKDFVYGIFDREEGRLVGGCGLHPRIGPSALEIGYWIVPDRWGQGLATEAAAGLTRAGFEVMGAARMEIRVAPDNTRSRAIPVKLGYREEGCLRKIAERAGGQSVDLVVYGMLRGELAESPASQLLVRTERFA